MSNSHTNNNNIPFATNLVKAGDPAMKAKAELEYNVPSHLDELNARIDELETAIGQDASGPVGRAFAIRAERSCDKDSDASVGHLYPKNHKHRDSSSDENDANKDEELV